MKKNVKLIYGKPSVPENNNLLPLDVFNDPWLYESNNYIHHSEGTKLFEGEDVGKWMLFYNKRDLNDKWLFAKTLYRENKLIGVEAMKCSTNYDNPTSSNPENGVIILYCSESSNKDKIINTGEVILDMFNYKDSQYIYYKTNLQTYQGNRMSGSKKNHTYKLLTL